MGVVLNLGSGIKVSDHPSVTNIDWSPYLLIARIRVLRRIAPILLDQERRERLSALPDNITVHNLKHGIPWPDSSVDVVYHSHFLEHLDRQVAPAFMREALRVLRPRGIQRIVVPDLERAVRAYLDHLASCEGGDDAARHDEYVAAIIEQSVRREAHGTATKRPIRRWIENLLIGDARRRGETHQWMYDRINLEALVRECGFVEVTRHRFDSSGVADWNAYGLDRNDDGSEYKPGSLYIEARKPA